jgi:hypothetical protein
LQAPGAEISKPARSPVSAGAAMTTPRRVTPFAQGPVLGRRRGGNAPQRLDISSQRPRDAGECRAVRTGSDLSLRFSRNQFDSRVSRFRPRRDIALARRSTARRNGIGQADRSGKQRRRRPANDSSSGRRRLGRQKATPIPIRGTAKDFSAPPSHPRIRLGAKHVSPTKGRQASPSRVAARLYIRSRLARPE